MSEMLQGLCKLSAVVVWIPLEHHAILYYLDVPLHNGQNLDACYVGYLLSSSFAIQKFKD